MINYYTVQTKPSSENKVRDLLLNRAVAAKMWQDSIFEILAPTEKLFITIRGTRKIVDKKVFPGYLFIKMYLDKNTEQLVRSTEGITGFVRSGDKPVPVGDLEMQKILKNLEAQEEIPKSNFKINDIIIIETGPFADFTGKIESVDETKGKVKAYINIFSRETLVELDIADISLNK